MFGTCINHITRASVRTCLGHVIGIEMRASVRHVWDMHRHRHCKTMSGTWHRHGHVRVSVRPCLGHGIDLIDEPV
ncbi:hypothetical protein F383_12561 [Gossypium arboreum]|uniref:Uncharacterized protein n=1 Tax=Gossypium arboreum TaxID=29729 RepID=A0A0B0PUH0_GOSAR|nr:hypothetical protein F383_12561 [Gossypium arboreum]